MCLIHTTHQPPVAETSSSKASVREHVKHQQAAPGYILAMLCRVLYERPTNCGTLHGQLALGFVATVTETSFRSTGPWAPDKVRGTVQNSLCTARRTCQVHTMAPFSQMSIRLQNTSRTYLPSCSLDQSLMTRTWTAFDVARCSIAFSHA